VKEMQALPLGRGEVRRRAMGGTAAEIAGGKPGGKNGVAILAFGSLLRPALEAGEELDATVANMRFVKPVDDELIAELARTHALLVTVEEHAVIGGAGSAVAESLARQGMAAPLLQLGLPDRFVDHGDQAQLLAWVGLDRAGIVASIRNRLA
jgi:1-deoxy-D-xylulose-5-phosphate synthase